MVLASLPTLYKAIRARTLFWDIRTVMYILAILSCIMISLSGALIHTSWIQYMSTNLPFMIYMILFLLLIRVWTVLLYTYFPPWLLTLLSWSLVLCSAWFTASFSQEFIGWFVPVVNRNLFPRNIRVALVTTDSAMSYFAGALVLINAVVFIRNAQHLYTPTTKETFRIVHLSSFLC